MHEGRVDIPVVGHLDKEMHAAAVILDGGMGNVQQGGTVVVHRGEVELGGDGGRLEQLGKRKEEPFVGGNVDKAVRVLTGLGCKQEREQGVGTPVGVQGWLVDRQVELR